LAAGWTVEPARAAARPTAGGTLRGFAPGVDGAAQPQPLRPLRSADAAQAGRALRSARGDAARERPPRTLGWPSPRRGARLVAAGGIDAAAGHADARVPLFRADAVRSQPRAVGQLRDRVVRPPHALRGRHGLRSVLPRDPAALRTDGSRAPPDRRLRAALVHAGRAHEPAGRGPGARRPRRGREHRHALRHVPAHDRGARRTAPRARTGAPRARRRRIALPHARVRRIDSGCPGRRRAYNGKRGALIMTIARSALVAIVLVAAGFAAS